MNDPDEVAAAETLVDQTVKAVHAIWHDGGSLAEAREEAVRRLVLYARSRHMHRPALLMRWTVRPAVRIGYQRLAERDCCA